MRLNMKLQFRFKKEEIEKILRENKISLRNFAYFLGISTNIAKRMFNEEPFEIDTKYLSEYIISSEETSTDLNDLIRKNK